MADTPPVDDGLIECAWRLCDVRFKPRRKDQRFHDPDCRKNHWAEAYHYTAHPCPLCTVVHDPEEREILDALELLLQQDHVSKSDVRALIHRRRAILHGD